MEGPALVETKSRIKAVNKKTKKGDTETPETSWDTYCEKLSIKIAD